MSRITPTKNQLIIHGNNYVPPAQVVGIRKRAWHLYEYTYDLLVIEIRYNIDKMRQSIVDSWPNNVDDSNAKNDWNWKPKYDLKTAFNDYIIPRLKNK